MAKILIVDDQKSILLTVEALLKSENHLVTACTNSIDALDKLNSEKFDLVITDAIMPVGTNGFVLTKTIRSTPNLSKIPVILLTGKREKSDVEKGIESGADDYIVKPIDPPLLLEKVNTILKKHGTATSNFVEAPVNSKAEWDSKTEIVSISELGLTIHSNLSAAPGSLIKINSSIFEDIGIDKPNLRVASLEPSKTNEGFYKIKTHFVGLSEKELTPIRLWIRAKCK